jgi:hypothetical protein
MKTTDKTIKQLALAAFPEYRGRKFFTEVQQGPLDLRSFWDEGSRDYFTFVRLADGETCAMPPQSPYDKQIKGMGEVTIPPGFVCVRHSYYCGREGGLTVITAGVPALQ